MRSDSSPTHALGPRRMDLARTSDLDEAEYERFLDGFATHPGTALAYHYPFYLRFLVGSAFPGAAVRFVAARDARGHVIGVMPALHVRTPRINVWLSLAYFGPNAGALVPDGADKDADGVACALVKGADADARERECGSLTMYTPLAASPAPYRAALGGVDFDVDRTSQWLTIPDDPDASPWPAKMRYYVRHAASRGVKVREIASDADLAALWDLYRERCEKQSIPVKPLAHIRTLFQTAGRHGVFLVAELDGRVIAGLICLIGGGVLSYYMPCARADVRALRPALALLDRAVAIGRAAGCRRLNFEASPAVGDSVYQFKAECGGVPVPFHVLVKLLRRDALDEYRALTPAGLRREAPNAFIVPFDAIS
ncbi:MAG: GNAT family N-acetyltransferase [Acidobacteria bacterium]|nr:GNAT family N-acetyltransferase [Acidobacteriota bacterium]